MAKERKPGRHIIGNITDGKHGPMEEFINIHPDTLENAERFVEEARGEWQSRGVYVIYELVPVAGEGK